MCWLHGMREKGVLSYQLELQPHMDGYNASSILHFIFFLLQILRFVAKI